MRLSVIIPVYNAGRYIGACLQSLYRQGLKEEDFEVIVVDDGSRDDSLIQVGRLAAFHSNIQIMTQKNQGVSAARNNGMKKAKGTYIYFMDADDYLMDATLGQLLAVAEAEQLEVVRGELVEVDQEGRFLRDSLRFEQRKAYARQLMNGFTFYENIFQGAFYCWLLLLKRDFLEQSSVIFNEQLAFLEDEDFITRLIVFARKAMYVPVVFYAYRQHSASAVATMNLKKLQDILLVLKSLKACAEQEKWEIHFRKKVRTEMSEVFYILLVCLISPAFYSDRKIFLEQLRALKIRPLVLTGNWKKRERLCLFNLGGERAVRLLYFIRCMINKLLHSR